MTKCLQEIEMSDLLYMCALVLSYNLSPMVKGKLGGLLFKDYIKQISKTVLCSFYFIYLRESLEECFEERNRKKKLKRE